MDYNLLQALNKATVIPILISSNVGVSRYYFRPYRPQSRLPYQIQILLNALWKLHLPWLPCRLWAAATHPCSGNSNAGAAVRNFRGCYLGCQIEYSRLLSPGCKWKQMEEKHLVTRLGYRVFFFDMHFGRIRHIRSWYAIQRKVQRQKFHGVEPSNERNWPPGTCRNSTRSYWRTAEYMLEKEKQRDWVPLPSAASTWCSMRLWNGR